MTQNTVLAEYMEAADMKARLDEACKKVLANKMILAWILKGSVEEFRDFDVNDIAEHYIEGNPEIAGTAVHQDTGIPGAHECIRGEDTVDKTITEGTVLFDIRFRAVVPSSGEQISLIINVEAQNDFYPGYPLVKRGIYYCCRLVSGQHGTEFTNTHYEKIKKVYSIWICMNPPRHRQNSINKYRIEESNVAGTVKEPKENYDLMTAVIICLDRSQAGIKEDAMGLLSILFSAELGAEQKKKLLEKDFGIPMTTQLEQEVTQMCNYSDGVEQRGIEKGREEGTFLTLCALVRDGLLKLEDAAGHLNMREEVLKEKMHKAGY